MDRRRFTRQLGGGAAALCLSATARGAMANQNDENEGFPSFGRIRLNTGRQVFIPVRMLVIDDHFNRQIGIDLNFRLQNENRAALLDPPLARQFQDRVEIGKVLLDDKGLIVRADQPVPPTEFRLSDFQISFVINDKKLSKSVEGTIPRLTDLPVVGALFRRKNDEKLKRNLLIFVTAKILEHDA